MGKGDPKERKPHQASSSAQAAQFLASRSTASGGFGFGGFSGSTPAVPAAAPGFAFGASAAARLAKSGSATSLASGQSGSGAEGSAASGANGEAQLSSQLDGEVAQCLRHMSKKDAVTKLKALQTLRALIKSKPASDLATALPPWVYLYQRLSVDGSRHVRTEAAATLGELVGAVGKAVAPHLKPLMGPWWLAHFDPHTDAAVAARTAFQTCFTGQKQCEALLFCCTDLLSFISEQATSNAQQLGDARKDTPEEMEERYERVVSAALLSLGTLLQVLTSAGGSTPGSTPRTAETTHAGSTDGSTTSPSKAAVDSKSPSSSPVASKPPTAQLGQVWQQVTGLLSRQGYVKSCIGSKSTLIRAAMYSLIREVCSCLLQARGSPSRTQEQDSAVLEGVAHAAGSAEVASAVLGVFNDKEAGNHAAMWAMVLVYIKAFPDCWANINVRKMFLPRLAAFLRHGCFGSHAVSWSALLPLMSLMPHSVISHTHDVAAQLLEATWTGVLDASTSRTGRAAAIDAYQECLQWLLTVAAQHAGGSEAGTATDTSANTYRLQLLHGTLESQPLSAVLAGSSVVSNMGLEIVVGLMKKLNDAAAKATAGGSAGSPAIAALHVAQNALSDSVAAAVTASLTTSTPNDVQTVCSAVEQLVMSLRDAAPQPAEVVGRVVVGRLVGSMQGATPSGAATMQLPPAASQLLASLIRVFGSSISSPMPQEPGTTGAVLDNGSLVASPAAAAAATGGPMALELNQLVTACMAVPMDSPAASAQAQLLVSWLLTSGTAQQDWAKAISELSGIPLHALQEPAASAAHLEDIITNQQEDGIRVVQLLCGCLVDSLTSHSHDSATSQPWHQALGGLLQLLATDVALDHVAAGVVLPVSVGGGYAAEDLSRAAASLSQDPVTTLISLLLGANHASMLLVPEQQALQAVQGFQRMLLDVSGIPVTGAGRPAVPTAAFYTELPGLLTLKQLTGAGCAALAACLPLLSPPSKDKRSTAKAPVWHAAPKPLASMLAGIVQLAWCLQAGAHAGVAYRPQLDAVAAGHAQNVVSDDDSDVEAADLGDATDSGLEDDFMSLSLAAAQEADSWLALSMHICSAAWPGQASSMLASLLTQQQQEKELLVSAAEELWHQLGFAVVASVQQQCRLARAKAGSAEQNRAAAAAAARVQQLLHSLPASSLTCNQFVQAVLHQTLDVLEQSLKGTKASGASNSKAAQCGGLQSDAVALLLFLAHMAHAVGAQQLLAAAAEAGSSSRSTQTDAAWLMVAMLCLEIAFLQSSMGGQVIHVVHTAARALLRCLASETDSSSITQVTHLLYSHACVANAASSTAFLRFPQALYASALQLFLRCISHALNGVQHLEQFCASHLLPATSAAASQQLQPEVLQHVLSNVASVLRDTSHGVSSASLQQVSINLMNLSLACAPVTLEPAPESVTRLQLAVACFPVPSRALHGAASTSPQSATLKATPQEEQLLVKLLKHQVVRQGAVAAARRTTPSDAETPLVNAVPVPARVAAACLELAAAAYCGPTLHAAEWHTMLSHVHASVSAAVQLLRSTVDKLCTSIKACGESLLGAAGSGSGMTGAVALQLLRQLQQRGVLTQHPAYVELVTHITQVLTGAQLDAELQPAVQAVLVLLQHLQYCSTRRADQLPEGLLILLQQYRQEVGDACDQLLQMVLVTGIAHSLCTAGGTETATAMTHWIHDTHSSSMWATAGAATCSFLDLSVKPGAGGLTAAAYSALSETDTWLATHDMALHTVDAMLSLALAPTQQHGNGHHQHQDHPCLPQPLVEAAYISLLHAPASVTCHLALPMESEAGELPEYEQGGDPCTYLMHAGLHPLLANVIGAPAQAASTSTLFTAWAVLLTHLSTASTGTGVDAQSAPNTVRQALGEVAHLAPDLLQQLLPYLTLQDYAPGRSNAARKLSMAGGAAAMGSASMQGGASAAAGVQDLRAALRQVGLPLDDANDFQALPQGQLAAVARLLYAGVLHVLPASARTWFSDLRDRSTAVAVEAYTAAQISPALIAAEMQDVQARSESLRGDQFGVRVNSSSREVIAVLTVEEGSSIELVIKLPPALPLKPAEVDCRRNVGVNAARTQKWLRIISVFLRSNNRGLADAIAMWRTNVESEFAGMEACLICYSVVAATNSALPRLQCHTCQVRFHPGCLYKWFKSSGKSVCPHCQSPW